MKIFKQFTLVAFSRCLQMALNSKVLSLLLLGALLIIQIAHPLCSYMLDRFLAVKCLLWCLYRGPRIDSEVLQLR